MSEKKTKVSTPITLRHPAFQVIQKPEKPFPFDRYLFQVSDQRNYFP